MLFSMNTVVWFNYQPVTQYTHTLGYNREILSSSWIYIEYFKCIFSLSTILFTLQPGNLICYFQSFFTLLLSFSFFNYSFFFVFLFWGFLHLFSFYCVFNALIKCYLCNSLSLFLIRPIFFPQTFYFFLITLQFSCNCFF